MESTLYLGPQLETLLATPMELLFLKLDTLSTRFNELLLAILSAFPLYLIFAVYSLTFACYVPTKLLIQN